jgi:signal transduction histidine kinase
VAVACFASVWYVGRIEDPDTRRGLRWLLLSTGGWAGSHVGFLLSGFLFPSTAEIAYAFYTVGLIVGLAAVGPWLYFCSAYTGRTLHRDRAYRRVLLGVFLFIVAVKVTNPLHGLYFEATYATFPFAHLAIQHQLFHWLAMGLAYGLSIIGYFMLLERFRQVSYDTRPLLVLLGATALPIVFDIVGFATPYLIDITYEPIGVAVFAVGLLTVYIYRFQAVQVTSGHDEPTLLLDDEDRIREYNDSAASLFEQLRETGLGEPLWSALPNVVEAIGSDTSLLTLECGDDTRYYRVSESTFVADQPQMGRLVVLTEVTEREQYRRELERQNDRLESFANMVSHDLRNPLNVAMARLELTRQEADDENLQTAAEALERMEALVDDVLALARQGQPIDEPTRVSLAALAESAWGMVEATGTTLEIEGDLGFGADADRLQQLFENLFRNSVEHGSTDPDAHLQIRVGPLESGDGFYVEDDGVGIPPEEREDVFESGYTTVTHGTGFGLAIVVEIVEAHNWSIDVTEGRDGGARFEIRGVESR